jgi:hypothetical protein
LIIGENRVFQWNMQPFRSQFLLPMGIEHVIEVVHGWKLQESCIYALVSPSEMLGRIAISQNLSSGMLSRSHLDS